MNNIIFNSSVMTIDICKENCRSNGQPSASLAKSSNCVCAAHHSTDSWDSVSTSKCNSTCAGNENQMCGGESNEVSIYFTSNRGKISIK